MTNESESVELARPSDSIVQVRIGNREYPMVRSTRCGICMHPGRFAIEEKILLNYGYPAIIKFVSGQEIRKDDGTVEEWPDITVMQIRHHRDAGHVALNNEMVQEITKRRAERFGVDIETYSGQFVDHVVAQKIVLQRGMERLVKGEIEPDMKDLLTASKLLGDLEINNTVNSSIEEYQELFVVFLRTVQSMVPRDQFEKIMKTISEHPTFKAIQQRRATENDRD